MHKTRRSTRRTHDRNSEEKRADSQWLEDSLSHVKELSDRVTELSTLMGLSSLLSSDRPLPEVLDTVCQLSAEICKAQVSFIHLADDSDGDLVCISRHLSAGLPEYTWEGIAKVYGRNAIQKGEVVYSSDLVVAREEDGQPVRSHMGGICSVPLKGASGPVGTLAVGYSNSHRFSAREKDMLSAVAGQVAMAVERSWLFDRLQEQLARARSLREVAANVAANLELDAVLDSIVDEASSLLAAEFSAIFLAAPGNGDSHVHHEQQGEQSCEVRLEDGSLASAVQQAVETGQPAITHKEVTESTPELNAEPKPTVYRSALAVPLLSGEEVLGALVVCYLDRRDFDSSDVSLAQDFASQAALAIRNARLYEEAMGDRVRLESAIDQINNHGIALLDEELNLTFANPATFWLLGVRPAKGKIAFGDWTARVKRGLAEGSALDLAIEQIRAHPQEILVTELAARGKGESPRIVKLASLPLRQRDGAIQGRIMVLEAATQSS